MRVAAVVFLASLAALITAVAVSPNHTFKGPIASCVGWMMMGSGIALAVSQL